MPISAPLRPYSIRSTPVISRSFIVKQSPLSSISSAIRCNLFRWLYLAGLLINVISSLALIEARCNLITNIKMSRPHWWSASLTAGSVSSMWSGVYVNIFTTVSIVLLSILRFLKAVLASSGEHTKRIAANLSGSSLSVYLQVRSSFLAYLPVRLSAITGRILLKRPVVA